MDLSRVGLVARSDLGDHAWRFELRRGDADHKAQHPHFLCVDCGAVNCLPRRPSAYAARPELLAPCAAAAW